MAYFFSIVNLELERKKRKLTHSTFKRARLRLKLEVQLLATTRANMKSQKKSCIPKCCVFLIVAFLVSFVISRIVVEVRYNLDCQRLKDFKYGSNGNKTALLRALQCTHLVLSKAMIDPDCSCALETGEFVRLEKWIDWFDRDSYWPISFAKREAKEEEEEGQQQD